MMDLRYHIVTLIGVFLALAAGVLMGAALFPSENQHGAVKQLEADMNALRQQDIEIRAENTRVQQQMASWERTAGELRQPLLRDRMTGERVAVIVCDQGQTPAYLSDLENTLRVSGADVGPRITLPDDPTPLDPAMQARMEAVWGGGSGGASGRYQAILWLVKGLNAGGQDQRLQDLARAAGFRVEGSLGETIRRFVVLVGSAEGERAARVATADLPEFAVFQAAGVEGDRAVFAAPETSPTTTLSALARRGALTVENADRVIGQMRIALAVAGNDSSPSSRNSIRPLLAQ